MEDVKLDAIEATPESFAEFGQVIQASPDGDEFGPHDAQLDLSQGIPSNLIYSARGGGCWRWRSGEFSGGQEASRGFKNLPLSGQVHPACGSQVDWVLGTLIFALIFGIRIYFIHGFYFITYALGIYILNLLIDFLSPLVDPELEASDGPLLPTKGSDEFKPFMRRLSEFKFWYSVTNAFFIAFMTTFFSVFDVSVFWPILLCYWVVLFVLTMKRQIAHMIKYRYIPFSIGKQKYGGKKPSKSNAASSAD